MILLEFLIILVKLQTFLHRMSIIFLRVFIAGEEMDFRSFGVLSAAKSTLTGKVYILHFFLKKILALIYQLKICTWIVNPAGIG